MTTPALIGAPSVSREWHLVSRPEGWPSAANFALRKADIPEVRPGQVLVRNIFLSVDPYMRGRMDAAGTSNPYPLDAPLDGRAVGVVVASQADGFAAGDHVRHMLGWREYAVVDAGRLTRADPFAAPLPAYLGVLGNAGLTAYAGLLRIAGLRTGEVVFATKPPAAPRNLMLAVLKSLRLEGIQVTDHADLEEQFVHCMSTWIREGSVRSRQTLVDGLENTVDAFLGLLRGENVGKMIVSLGE